MYLNTPLNSYLSGQFIRAWAKDQRKVKIKTDVELPKTSSLWKSAFNKHLLPMFI